MNKIINKEIILDGKKIKYILYIKNVKNINLRINSEGNMRVSANSKVHFDTIDNFIKSNSKNILKAIDKAKSMKSDEIDFNNLKNGDKIKLFGTQKTILISEGRENYVSVSEDNIIIIVKDITDNLMINKALTLKINSLCEEVVNKLCENNFIFFSDVVDRFPTIKFRNMKTKWGSCQPDKKILTFSYMLSKVPVDCINYVVVHEFCHFIHPNHSKDFYKCLSEYIPNWKELKNKLES